MFLFLHVMKTGGTSLLWNLAANFPPPQMEPEMAFGKGGSERPPTYGRVDLLMDMAPERRRELRLVAGHFPYAVVDLVQPDVVFTILRHPVQRTVSLLKQLKRYQPATSDRSLEELYEDPYASALLIRDYQSKLFALQMGEPGVPDNFAHMADYPMDAERLERAKANLEQVDVIGLHERYDEFLATLSDRFGWRFERHIRARRATEPWEPSRALLRRIEEDNEADMAFYEHARSLYEQRRRGGAAGRAAR